MYNFINFIILRKKQTLTQVFSCGICETFKKSGRCFWKHATYYYVGHRLVTFNAVPFNLLHLLLTRWWDMRLKHDVAWLWEEQADSRNMCQNKKKYCLCCIILIKTDTILSSISKIIFKICISGSCSPSWATKQTYLEILLARRHTLVAQNRRGSVRLHHWQLLRRDWILSLEFYTLHKSKNCSFKDVLLLPPW